VDEAAARPQEEEEMKKTLRATIEIEIKPYTAKEMAHEALMCGLDKEDGFDGPAELPSASEIADLLVGSLENEDTVQEMFAGSNVFVHLGKASFVSAEYTTP
jgi:hypothetical protein